MSATSPLPREAAPGGRSCSVEGCPNPYRAKGLCSTHYNAQARATDRPDRAQCIVEGCTSPAHARGLCNKHYQRLRKHGTAHFQRSVGRPVGTYTKSPPCAVDGCERTSWRGSNGLCPAHATRVRKHGDPGSAEIATREDDYTRLPTNCYLDGDDGTGLSIVVGCDNCERTFGPTTTREQAIELAWAHTLERHR